MSKESGNHKGRRASTYQHKVDRVRKWYAHMVANREATGGDGKPKKELKPLEYYIEKIKGPTKA